MSADRTDAPDASLLAWPLNLATRLALSFPAATVALAVAVTVVSVAYTWQNLGYRTSRLDLLNPESDYTRLWMDYINEFGDEDDAVVVVEGASRDQVVPVLEEISAMLAREDRLFHAVLHGVDLEKILAKGLHYLSQDELRGIEQFLASVSPIVEQGEWPRLNLGGMLAAMNERLLAAARQPNLVNPELAVRDLERLTESLLAALGQKTAPGEQQQPPHHERRFGRLHVEKGRPLGHASALARCSA